MGQRGYLGYQIHLVPPSIRGEVLLWGSRGVEMITVEEFVSDSDKVIENMREDNPFLTWLEVWLDGRENS